MKPLHYEAVCKMLLERFGEPIGNAPAVVGVPDEREDAKSPCCDQCGSMPMEADSACECSGMNEVDAFQGPSERDKFWAMADDLITQYGDADMGAEEMLDLLLQNDIPRDIALDMVEDVRGERLDEEDLDQKTPPGGEKVVKALKKDKGVDNPWAVAWAMKNRGEI